MSTEEQLAAVVESGNSLIETFNKKEVAIDAKVVAATQICIDAALALPGSLGAKIYVDPIVGLNTNAGKSTSPVKTLKYAIETLAPQSGSATIYILSAIDITEDIVVNKNQQLFISSGQPNKIDIRMRLYEHTPESSPNEYKMAALGHIGWAGNVSVILNNVRILFPDISELPAGGTHAVSYSNSLFTKKASYQPHVFVGFYKVDFVVPATPIPYFYVIGDAWGSQSISANSMIYTVSEMAGRWVYGVAAGTPPKDTGRVLSNLASL